MAGFGVFTEAEGLQNGVPEMAGPLQLRQRIARLKVAQRGSIQQRDIGFTLGAVLCHPATMAECQSHPQAIRPICR